MHFPQDFITAFAPATVGNVGVGFDILGHAMHAVGDRVSARRTADRGVQIASVTGLAADLPLEPGRNCAGAALLAMVHAMDLRFGIEISIEKGIPLGSGLGGSAASAVAAVVAANALLEEPLPKESLLQFALAGEAVASGSAHVDNVAASLFGGLVLAVGIDPPVIRQVPVPPQVRSVLVHPHMFLATREARRMLRQTVGLRDVVRQTANLAGFIAGCYSNDLALIRAAFEDVMIEPQRARLIPGFAAVKQAAMMDGALGCSISGAGPTVFAWCEDHQAGGIRAAMVEAFTAHGLACDHWISAIATGGASVVAG